jgi:ankyrin repeat protein
MERLSKGNLLSFLLPAMVKVLERKQSTIFLGKDNCVRWILDHGVDVNQTKKNGDNSLHYAAHNGFSKVVELLIERNANINATNR